MGRIENMLLRGGARKEEKGNRTNERERSVLFHAPMLSGWLEKGKWL
jgi:hypothetical protein